MNRIGPTCQPGVFALRPKQNYIAIKENYKIVNTILIGGLYIGEIGTWAQKGPEY